MCAHSVGFPFHCDDDDDVKDTRGQICSNANERAQSQHLLFCLIAATSMARGAALRFYENYSRKLRTRTRARPPGNDADVKRNECVARTSKSPARQNVLGYTSKRTRSDVGCVFNLFSALDDAKSAVCARMRRQTTAKAQRCAQTDKRPKPTNRVFGKMQMRRDDI